MIATMEPAKSASLFDTGPVFLANKESKKKIVVNQGGTSSGKTYSIMQLLFYKAITEPRVIVTVVAESIPNIRKGAYRDAETIFANSDVLQDYVAQWNKTDRIVYFKNGSLIEFTSFETEQSAKNGKRDYLFCNEVNGISYQIYWQLFIRARKQVFHDYNPTSRFWIHEKVIPREDCQLIISDHRHNPFIAPELREEIESLKFQDEELFKVYGRGKTGKITGLVLPNWGECKEIPADAKLVAYGLDFGFTNDPTGLLGVWLQDGQLWCHEYIYQTKLTNPDIAREVKALNITSEIVADSAEPKSIVELRTFGLNVHPALKGPDSIKNGLDILKRYRINVTSSSTNLKKELLAYKWRIDKVTGETMNEPIDAFNHLIDPLRYVALNKIGHKKTISFF